MLFNTCFFFNTPHFFRDEFIAAKFGVERQTDRETERQTDKARDSEAGGNGQVREEEGESAWSCRGGAVGVVASAGRRGG